MSERNVSGIFDRLGDLLEMKRKFETFLDKLGLSVADVMKFLDTVGDMPDWSSATSIHTWLVQIAGLGTKIASATENEIDDAAMRIVNDIMLSPEVWSAIEGLREAIAGVPLVGDDKPPCDMDPATIALIISAISSIIRFIIEKRRAS